MPARPVDGMRRPFHTEYSMPSAPVSMCQMRSRNSAGAKSSIAVGGSRMCPSESMYRSARSSVVVISHPLWS